MVNHFAQFGELPAGLRPSVTKVALHYLRPNQKVCHYFVDIVSDARQITNRWHDTSAMSFIPVGVLTCLVSARKFQSHWRIMMTKIHFRLIAVVIATSFLTGNVGAQTVNISNGVVGAGHLDVNIDAFGSYGNFNLAFVDNFQPTGSTVSQPSFTAGFRLFSGTNKALLTSIPAWLAALPVGDPETLVKVITSPISNSSSSMATSSFNVNLPNGSPFLSFAVTHSATSPTAGVGLLSQEYIITNTSGGALSFSMNRVLDSDLIWDNDFLSDHVSVDSSLDFVGTHEPGSTTQAMALSSGPGGTPHSFYWGSKNLHVPTGGPPAMGFGTDVIVWANDGLPATWQNYIAFSGYNVPGGDSGFNSNDAHIGIDWVLNLATGASATLQVRTVYGALALDDACLLGDVNMDGIVSLLDVAPFVTAVTSGVFQCEADANEDGVVSLLDVAPFVAILTGG